MIRYNRLVWQCSYVRGQDSLFFLSMTRKGIRSKFLMSKPSGYAVFKSIVDFKADRLQMYFGL